MARRRNLEGLEQVRRTFAAATPVYQERITNAMNKGAAEIETTAKATAPVDTGEIRGAIEVRDTLEGFRATGLVGRMIREQRARRGAGVQRFIGVFPDSRAAPGWYAAFVEFGTRLRPATPFLFPAFWSLRRRVQGRVKREIRAAGKDLARRSRG